MVFSFLLKKTSQHENDDDLMHLTIDVSETLLEAGENQWEMALGPNTRLPTVVMVLFPLRHHGHLLHMSVYRLPFRAFLDVRTQLKELMWWLGYNLASSMKNLPSVLTGLVGSRLCGWGSSDEDCRWLGALRNVDANGVSSACKTNAVILPFILPSCIHF